MNRFYHILILLSCLSFLTASPSQAQQKIEKYFDTIPNQIQEEYFVMQRSQGE
jgi:hypothetical protein